MSDQAAKDLALVLNSGALPAGIKYLEERTVGPSLGSDSIRSGVRAAIIGMFAVLIFMLVYYRGAGINADLALILNLIILLGFMGYYRRHAHPTGNRGSDPDCGHGRGLERPDFRAHPRRTAKREDSSFGGGARLRACLDHDRRHSRDHYRLGSDSVHVWHRSGEGFRHNLAFGLLANLFTAVFVSRTIFDGF